MNWRVNPVMTFDCSQEQTGNRLTLRWISENCGGISLRMILKMEVKAFRVELYEFNHRFIFITRNQEGKERLRLQLATLRPILQAGYMEQVGIMLDEITVE